MRELAERLYLDPSNLTALVDRLEALGLVERQADPDDRHVKRLVITDKGTRLSDEIIGAVFEERVPSSTRCSAPRAAPAPRSAQPSGRSTRPRRRALSGRAAPRRGCAPAAVTMRCDLVLEAGARNRATPCRHIHVEQDDRPARRSSKSKVTNSAGRSSWSSPNRPSPAFSFWCRDRRIGVRGGCGRRGRVRRHCRTLGVRRAHDEHDVNAARRSSPSTTPRTCCTILGATVRQPRWRETPPRDRHRQGRGWRYPPALVAASSSSSRSGCCVTFVQVAKTSRYPWRPGTLHFS